MTTARRTTFGAVDRDPPGDIDRRVEEGWRHVAGEVSSLAGRVVRDVALAQASGRWRPGQPDPDHYLPGDAVALRAFAVTPEFERLGHYRDALRDPRTSVRIRREAAARAALVLSDVHRLYDAVPYFLDGDTAAGLLASRPPDPSVVCEWRLPHPRIALFLGRVFELPASLQDWPAAWDQTLDLAGRPTGLPSILGHLRARGGGVEGVLLTELPGGGIADEVAWLVSAAPDPRLPAPHDQDRQRGVVWGRLSASHLAHVGWNLAATLVWGEWREARPIGLPVDVASHAWRKAVRRGEFRRREPHGAAAGIHVLDLPRRRLVEPHDHRRQPSSEGRSSPTAHLRRAHWRLQPVGPGAAERRLTRVAATVVNAGAGPLRPVVYRIPEPDPPASDRDEDPHRVDWSPRPPESPVDLRTVKLPAPIPPPRRRRDIAVELEP